MTTGLLVVDVQPAYGAACSFIAPQVATHINNTVKPVTILWVGEGLTEDTEYDVRDYLHSHGALSSRLNEARFVEKNYGYYRSWMDLGVEPDDIIKVGRQMAAQGAHCSDQVDMEALFQGSVPWLPSFDVLHHCGISDAVLSGFSAMETCGGGADECLAETELWLEIMGMKFKRLDSLVY